MLLRFSGSKLSLALAKRSGTGSMRFHAFPSAGRVTGAGCSAARAPVAHRGLLQAGTATGPKSVFTGGQRTGNLSLQGGRPFPVASRQLCRSYATSSSAGEQEGAAPSSPSSGDRQGAGGAAGATADKVPAAGLSSQAADGANAPSEEEER